MKERNDKSNNENNMQQIILSHLEDVEQQNNVKVLLAVESGSRAWGFHSAESDWDVRFVYVHNLDWYLKVNEGRDVIEHMYDDDVDLVGWDLRKTLRLFQKSNPALMEWLHSPIIYRADEVFLSRMRGLEPTYFNPIKVMYHYGSIYIKHDKRIFRRMLSGIYDDRLRIIDNIPFHSVYDLDIVYLLVTNVMESLGERLHDTVIGDRDRIMPP